MVSKVLICGFGAFGELHATAWRRLDPAITLMVADPAERARSRALQLGIAPNDIAADPTALLNSADIVDIVAPPAFHMALALQALAVGKPVMIEKPAVETVADARALLEAAGDLPVQVGLVLRAHPLVSEAARLMAEGEIGELLAMDGDFSGWKRMRADSSLLENDGVHFLDLMRHFAGAPAIEVEARSWSLLDAAVADDITIEISFVGGVRGRLRLGVLIAGEVEDAFVPGAVTTKRLTLVGRTGNIAIDFNRNTLTTSTVSYTRSSGGHHVQPQSVASNLALGATPEALLSRSFAIFCNALRAGTPVLCDARQGALELAATLAAVNAELDAETRRPSRIQGDLL